MEKFTKILVVLTAILCIISIMISLFRFASEEIETDVDTMTEVIDTE
jgi:cytochrome b subunit of formate dehydrogenase